MKTLIMMVIGAPGSGKSTIVKGFAKEFHKKCRVISTGDFARALRDGRLDGDTYADLQDRFNKESKELRARGESGRRVGDDVIIEYVRREIGGLSDEEFAVLDGFPRSVMQASTMANLDLDMMLVECVVSRDVASKRYMNRDRSDAVLGVFERRYDMYASSRDGIVEALSGKAEYILLDAGAPMKESLSTLISKI